ncbi:MAG: hypothetical protein ACE5F5_00865 [Acidimicrobiia bacterium]
MRKRTALLLLAAGLLAGACTGGAPEPDSAPPAENVGTGAQSVVVPSEPDPTLLPLAWFMARQSDPGDAIIDDAVDHLIARCMAERGFQVPEYPKHDHAQSLRYWYGLVKLEEALADGYTGIDAAARAGAALAEATPSDEEAGEAISPDPARREAYLAALHGTEEDVIRVALVDPITGEHRGTVGLGGGCRGEAREAVFGGVDKYLAHQRTMTWLQRAVWDIRIAADNLEATREAAQAWLECMTDHGFPPDHRFWPFDVNLAGNGEVNFLGALPTIGPDWQALPEPRPSPEEIEMAVADVTCKEESGWTMLVFTAEYRRQDELAAAAAEFIRQGQKIRAEAVERARTILAEG